MEELPIGKLVRANLDQIFEHCSQSDPEEIVKLSDKAYCKDVFNLDYAFLATPAEATLIQQESGHPRYWVEEYHVMGHEVRVTNYWFSRNRVPFLLYLLEKGLTPQGISPGAVDAELAAAEDLHLATSTSTSTGGARYRKTAIGVAQNAVARHVLGSLGHDAFTEKQWIEVKSSFGFRCAYCHSGRQVVMDHAVPISINELGEHRLGNLVPACHDCNSAKGEKRYDDYLRTQAGLPDPEGRIVAIQAHMRSYGYQPLADTLDALAAKQVREQLQQLREQIKQAAEATVTALNEARARQETPPR